MFQFPANPTVGQQFSAAAGITYQWDGTGWMAVVASGSATELLAPPGVVMPYAGAAPFTGWLLCDGKSYATSSLPALFAVIGYTYGGSGAVFNVPDLRGRVIAGVDNMGGAAAGRLTATVASTLGGAGGSEQVTLTQAMMPAHAHTVSDPGHTHGVNDPQHSHVASGKQAYGLNTQPNTGGAQFVSGDRELVTVSGASASTNISIAAGGVGFSATNNAGSGSGHLNVQPTIALNYIIKT